MLVGETEIESDTVYQTIILTDLAVNGRVGHFNGEPGSVTEHRVKQLGVRPFSRFSRRGPAKQPTLFHSLYAARRHPSFVEAGFHSRLAQ